MAYVLRLTRTSVAKNMRTATAKGLDRKRVVTVHLLRNSMITVVTFLGADLDALMGNAIITEGFNVPGVGGSIVQAITVGETATVVSFVTVLVMIYLMDGQSCRRSALRGARFPDPLCLRRDPAVSGTHQRAFLVRVARAVASRVRCADGKHVRSAASGASTRSSATSPTAVMGRWVATHSATTGRAAMCTPR